MPRLAVLTDADACIPAALRDSLGILTAPLDPQPFREDEPPVALRRDAQPVTPPPAIQAFARAAAEAESILYVTDGDGYGGSPLVEDAVSAVAAMSPLRRTLRIHRSEMALMGCGWQAVAAAAVARAGGSLEAAEAAARAVRDEVEVLVMLEHPQFAGVSAAIPGMPLRTRAIFRLWGERIDVVDRIAKREAALAQLRDRFAHDAVGSGALHVAIHHAGARAAAEAMARWVTRTLVPAELVLAPLTRHAATRLGPGMVGFAWYRELP